MSRKRIVGREDEIRRLDRCMEETAAQLVILYGRRRVGKTYLINEYFEGRFDFKITGAYREKRDVQLRHFAEELAGQYRQEVSVPRDWTEAFRMLRTFLLSLPQDEKHVVFFDEMPWLDTMHSGFLPAFEYFWNDFGCSLHGLVFIVCGSATSWMTKKIAHNKGGLFNRQACSIYLQPFSLKEVEEYLLSKKMEWSRYDVTECYMILGGIPYYLSLLDSERSLASNIDNLFFRKRAELWNEFSMLYSTLFQNSTLHIRIVEALSTKKRGMTRQEIIKATGADDNGALSEALEDLANSDFVRVYKRFGERKNEPLFQLKDYFSLFYYRFIRDGHGRDEHFWTHSYGSPARYAWAGLTFEQVCKDHVGQIKRKIGIAAVLSEESSWSVKGEEGFQGAQVDLMIDRRDHVIDLCEIKYAEDEYAIDREYEQILRRKREVFRQATKTKKTIQIVMITTYGVKQNKYSSIVTAQVVLDDLFA